MPQIPQIKLLINLARIDGEVGENERQYITNIAKANGLDEKAVNDLFGQSHEVIVPENLNDEQKFDYIFRLVTLMKIDEKLYAEEIRFCAKVASKLGYDEQVLFDLMLHVKPASMSTDEITALRELTRKYLS